MPILKNRNERRQCSNYVQNLRLSLLSRSVLIPFHSLTSMYSNFIYFPFCKGNGKGGNVEKTGGWEKGCFNCFPPFSPPEFQTPSCSLNIDPLMLNEAQENISDSAALSLRWRFSSFCLSPVTDAITYTSHGDKGDFRIHHSARKEIYIPSKMYHRRCTG